MTRQEVITGNRAVANGVRLARPDVVPIVPITPQTSIAEYLSEFVARGELDADIINIDGEHSAMSACYGAQLFGARSFTATCSHGLAFMSEPIAQATAYRLPIVMAVTNRRLGSLHSGKPDYTDSMPQRDAGWMQFYVESNQEALDMMIQAYRIAEDERVLLPAMTLLDGFYLSYSNEPVSIPDQSTVDEFLPSYEASHVTVDPTERFESPLLTAPAELIGTYERLYQDAMERAKDVVCEVDSEFEATFGRSHGGLVETYLTDGARAVLVTMGSMTTAARRAVENLRGAGRDVGLVKVRTFRPFPAEAIREIGAQTEAIAVVDRSVSRGGEGGPLYSEVRSALFDSAERPELLDFIAGLAGADITVADFEAMAEQALDATRETGTGPRIEYLEDQGMIEQYSPPPEPEISTEGEVFSSGLKSCSGCGMTLGLRHALDVFGEDTVMPIPSSCALAVTRGEPYTTPLGVPIIPTNMPSPGGVMTGVRRAMKQRGKDEMHVLGFCGDGSTADIGFSSLSGAAQRGESVVWLTYDNDGYMNTGVQWSSSTPAGAVTSTTPEGSEQASGEGIPKKSVPLMMALHDGVAYVATASVAFVDDLRQKLETAKEVTVRDEGMAYVQLQAPCPPGWRFPEDETVDVARAAVRSGAWPLFEVRDGGLTLNHKPSSREPVGDFLARQGRFSHLSEEQIEQIATDIDRNWERLVRLDEAELFQ